MLSNEYYISKSGYDVNIRQKILEIRITKHVALWRQIPEREIFKKLSTHTLP